MIHWNERDRLVKELHRLAKDAHEFEDIRVEAEELMEMLRDDRHNGTHRHSCPGCHHGWSCARADCEPDQYCIRCRKGEMK